MNPGWYPDPHAPGMVRWWDGSGWSDMSMPKDLAPATPSTADRVMEGLGSLAKLVLLLVLLVLLAVLLPLFWVMLKT